MAAQDQEPTDLKASQLLNFSGKILLKRASSLKQNKTTKNKSESHCSVDIIAVLKETYLFKE
jgi:hypothetical protein